MADEDLKVAIAVSSQHEEEVAPDTNGISPVEGRKLIRRADWRLLPTLTLLYGLSFIDRANLSNARIVGMSDDLNLTGNKYNVILMVFFITYTLFEIPSNAVIRRAGVSRYLTTLIVCWGVIAMCCGFVKSFSSLCGLRVLLGLFEAGFNVC
jgi:sugar phosphate permease